MNRNQNSINDNVKEQVKPILKDNRRILCPTKEPIDSNDNDSSSGSSIENYDCKNTIDSSISSSSTNSDIDKDECRQSSNECTTGSNRNEDDVIIVKFVLGNGDTFTESRNLSTRIIDIKKELSKYFSVPDSDIRLLSSDEDGVELTDCKRLADVQVKSYASVTLTVLLTTPCSTFNIDKSLIYRHVPTAVTDVITVRVTDAEGRRKHITVEIENQSSSSSSRIITTNHQLLEGNNYVEAATQTSFSFPIVDNWKKFSKSTNTPISRYVQTSNNKNHVYIPSINDKILTPSSSSSKYRRQSSMEFKTKSAIAIQRAFRKWKNKKTTSDDDGVNTSKDDGEEEDFRREMNDIKKARTSLRRWYERERKLISDNTSAAVKRTELSILLNRYIALSLNIEAKNSDLRKRLGKENRFQVIRNACEPIRFFSEAANKHIEMDTLRNQWMRKLYHLYEKLIESMTTSSDERKTQTALRVIKELQEFFNTAVEKYDNRIRYQSFHGRHLTDLFQRLQHHLRKNSTSVSSALLDRIEEIILHLACYENWSQDRLLQQRPIYETITSSCGTDNDDNYSTIINLEEYRRILWDLRKDEINVFKCYASITCFKVRLADVYDLVHLIWQDRPILRCEDDIVRLRDLRLTRWDKRQEWSPWNCVLLFQEDAKKHLRSDVDNVYGSHYASRVKHKHIAARIHFLRLLNRGTSRQVKNTPFCKELLS